MPLSVLVTLLEAIDQIRPIDYCFCGVSKPEHPFKNDRIYDYQWLPCPDRLGGEFRLDAQRTRRVHLEAKALALAAMIRDYDANSPAT